MNNTRFYLKLTILDFWIKLTQKSYFQSEKMKIAIEFYIFELIYSLVLNILELYNVLVQIRLTASKTKRDV